LINHEVSPAQTGVTVTTTFLRKNVLVTITPDTLWHCMPTK